MDAPQRRPVKLWVAKPHTIAKIAILRYYLNAWFPILGSSRSGDDLLYVDGFAGPGHYANDEPGSPVAALTAAREVLAKHGARWRGGTIRCFFIEAKADRAAHLDGYLRPFHGPARLDIRVRRTSFEDGIARLRAEFPQHFNGARPLFVFIDPFGATGISFATVSGILQSARSEVLINFDSDGFDRIRSAIDSENTHPAQRAQGVALLNDMFGTERWRDVLPPAGATFRTRVLAMLDLYKAQLRALPNVRYVYAFEMLTANRRIGQVGYFLIFASQHHLGLEKMKEAMKRMDQQGTGQFSNALVDRSPLFRFDHPEDEIETLAARFSGQGPVGYADVRDVALNETHFANPKSMLRVLDHQNRLLVQSTDPKRKKGTFVEEKIVSIEFVEG